MATRASFEEHLHTMRTEYRDALVSKGRREAFDRLVEAWSSELGAISYAESFSLMDLILLTGEVDNRAYLEALRLKLDNLDAWLNEAEQRTPSIKTKLNREDTRAKYHLPGKADQNR